MTGEFAIAVHALVYLDHKKSYVSSEELAKNVCTNPARIRMVMGRLKKAGIITTREGVTGGYAVCCDAAALSLRAVSDAVQARFVGSAWRSGDMDMNCLVASGMADVIDGLYAQMDEKCREHLARMTLKDVSDKIFSCKERPAQA
ncbi:MAG: Rrf2 family transcriptional regulator [Cloacibacillus sp.]